MVFSGMLVELDGVIKVLSWIKWVSIFRFASNALNVNEFKNLELCPTNNNTANCTNGEYILKDRNIDYATNWDLWKNFVALGLMTIILFILTYIQLVKIKKFK
ncbi:unnamed protein product [Rotaria sp. Silwood2]|nr:unnamed protein product [Rotaria sp. Silwood2]CAF4359997.1 unnamed protein product [Rotaria sp. Silwood2]